MSKQLFNNTKTLNRYLIYYFLFSIILFSPALEANGCRLETEQEVALVKQKIGNTDMIVIVCPHCQKTEPVPLRIESIDFKHFEPDNVLIPFYPDKFSVEQLEEAEQKDTGALAETLREKIEKEYEDETGYLPNDPYLVKEKLDRYKMLLRFARDDYEMKVWDELLINGNPANPALVYYPVGNNKYRNLGLEIDCDIYIDALKEVTYNPVIRDPAKAAPPDVFIADITHQCYDGSCPAPEWTVIQPTPYFNQENGKQIGTLKENEVLKPLQTLTHVTGAKAVAIKDHDHIFAGDIFYILDSQAEGFYRLWHYGNVFIDDAGGIRMGKSWNYCEQKNNCWAESETQPASVWWSKVKRQNGEVIWIREPIQTLSGVLVD